ncbi:MAG: hypothetical protein P8M80_09780, partial [Pirellulaceae bacterium]|nr:hypothetical protein [Pirellulaceae bacterium]
GGKSKIPPENPESEYSWAHRLIGADHRGKRGILPILFTESSSKLGEILRPSAPNKFDKATTQMGFYCSSSGKTVPHKYGASKKLP